MANSDKVIGIFPETAETGIPRILFVGSGNKPVNLRVENNNNINFVNSSGTSIFSINENGSGIFVNNIPVSISGHLHKAADITDLPVSIKGSEILTSSKSVFTVNGGYSVGSLDVFLNGVKLYSSSDFTASNGTSFTLSEPAPSGSVVEYLALVPSLPVGAYSSVKDYEIVSSNKSTFVVNGGYSVGNLDVYHNGIKLVNSQDYTATNGSSFTLSVSAISGDVVEWSGYGSVPRMEILLGEVRSDYVGNTNYIGTAVAGSSESSGVWNIKKYVIADNGIDITTTSVSNAIWNNRLSLTYS